MQAYFGILQNCPLFSEMSETEIRTALDCLGAKTAQFRKNETVFSEGKSAKHIGIVLSGAVQIVRIDYFGNRSITASVGPSELFGESFACAMVRAIPIDAVAAEDTAILFLDFQKLLAPSGSSCALHQKLIFNLLKITASKNLQLLKKSEITSKRTTREKLMTYLHMEAKRAQSNRFEIPYDRQALADYLEVDRSGLSAEISKLRKEGVLSCTRNRFELL